MKPNAPNVPPEFQDIFFPSLDDENPDVSAQFGDRAIDDNVRDPIGEMFRQTEDRLNKAVGVAEIGWDERLTTSAVPLIKGKRVNFEKGMWGYRLGIVSVEQKEINGEKWNYFYDAAGELVDARLIGG